MGGEQLAESLCVFLPSLSSIWRISRILCFDSGHEGNNRSG